MATTHRDQPAIINRDSLLAAVEESLFGMTSTGFCIHCGAEAVHVEPDAVNDHCEPCGRRGVVSSASRAEVVQIR